MLSNFISCLLLVLQGLHNPFEILYTVKNCSQEFRCTGLPFTPLFLLCFLCMVVAQGGKTLETHLLRPLGSELLLSLLLSLLVLFSCNQGCQIHFLFQQLHIKRFSFLVCQLVPISSCITIGEFCLALVLLSSEFSLRFPLSFFIMCKHFILSTYPQC